VRNTWFMSFVVVLLTGCLDPTPPGFAPPRDGVELDGDETRVFRTGFENPLLTGRAPLRLNEMGISRELSDNPLLVEEQSYFPDGVRVRSSAYTRGTDTRYAWLEVPAREPGGDTADFVRNWRFQVPSISLPMGGARQEFILEVVRGEKREPDPGGIPEFPRLEVEEVDRVQLALDPRVLVVPVRLMVFTDPDGRMGYNPDELFESRAIAQNAFRQWFDPGAATELNVTQSVSPFEAKVLVDAGRNEMFDDIVPDNPWHTCGIQFHLDEVEFIAQDQGLEQRLITETSPCTDRPSPLSDFFPSVGDIDDAFPAVPVFVGGIIQPEILMSLSGLVCGPADFCFLHGRTNDDYVALDGFTAFSESPWTLAHELGHFLGLGHEGGSACEGDLAASNLMRAGGPRPPSLETATLTTEQCERARCLAATWLRKWEIVSASVRERECSGLL